MPLVHTPPRQPLATHNKLLGRLPPKDLLHVMNHCDVVELSFSEVLAEPGKRIKQVLFPTSSFISQTVPMTGHTNLEVGMIGNEGMLGADLILGTQQAPFHALAQGAGQALRMKATMFIGMVKELPALERLIKLYLYLGLKQLAQTAACTRYHVVEERLARWLLMTADRAHASEFHITHEFLAFMLGVRRVGITKAAMALQQQGLIHYHRGNIAVIDRKGLEAASCECYAVDKTSYGKIMQMGKPKK